ncbi:hypothetical protein BC332_25959 [Capsicum chinense]|nr:hypothetical protein BC332_25959 [Capsicum chinense]
MGWFRVPPTCCGATYALLSFFWFRQALVNYRAFLAASRLYGNADLAGVAAKQRHSLEKVGIKLSGKVVICFIDTGIDPTHPGFNDNSPEQTYPVPEHLAKVKTMILKKIVRKRYDFVFDEGVPNRIVEKYFNGTEFIQKKQLFIAFTEKVWGKNNDEDAEKFAILYFLHFFVLSNVDIVVITRLHFDLVDSGRDKDFPWGTLSFEDLTRSLTNRLKAGVDLDDDFQDPPPKQINEHSKKKQKVDSSTPTVKKLSRKKSVNIVDKHTQKRTPAPRVVKAADKDSELQHMNFAGAETSLQRFSPNVDQNLGENQDGTKIIDDKMDETNLSDSQFIIPDELLPSLNAYRRERITAHPLKTHEEEPTDEHLNDKKFESVVKNHCQQIDVCFYYLRKKSKYDPNKSYKFSTVACNFMNMISHYQAILTEIDKLAEIIPLCLQACDFYYKKGIDFQNHPRYKDGDSPDMFDVLFEENLPQQPNESLDCGLYKVTYAECLSYGHKVLSTEFDPNALRTRYIALVWDYGIRKQEANAHRDVEAPLRPARQSRITSLPEGRLNFGGCTISLSTLSEIIQSSWCASIVELGWEEIGFQVLLVGLDQLVGKVVYLVLDFEGYLELSLRHYVVVLEDWSLEVKFQE